MKWRRASGRRRLDASAAGWTLGPVEVTEIEAPQYRGFRYDPSEYAAPRFGPSTRSSAPQHGRTQPATPRTDGAMPMTCVRLNCTEQGRPTDQARCPCCDHPTQLLRTFRWPRAN